MRVAVTGASGLLGRRVVAELLEHPRIDVVAISAQPPSALRRIVLEETRNVRAADLEVVPREEASSWFRANAVVDCVVNCAFPRDLGGVQLANGLTFHQRLLRDTYDSGAMAFLNVSSQSVYDAQRKVPANEAAELSLDTPYATAKFAVELMVSSAYSDREFMNARMASLIAPSFEQRVVNKLVRRALSAGTLRISRPNQVFDYMDVRDAARAVVAIVRDGLRPEARTLNIGAGRPLRLLEVAGTVADAVRARVGRDVVVTAADSVESGPSSALDIGLLRSTYDFESGVSLRTTVDHIVDLCLSERQDS